MVKWKNRSISKKEFSKRVSRGMKAFYKKHPEHRKKVSIAIRLKYLTEPEYREKTSKAMKKVFREHPNLKREFRKNFLKFALTHPKFLKNLFAGKGNPNPLDTPTLKKISGKRQYVRSKQEVKVADTLYANNIDYLYESKLILFKKDMSFVIPDFWLAKQKIFIEVLGGYPGSQKKARWKKKYYKKYKIKCIFLNKKQILNLRRNLLDKLR